MLGAGLSSFLGRFGDTDKANTTGLELEDAPQSLSSTSDGMYGGWQKNSKQSMTSNTSNGGIGLMGKDFNSELSGQEFDMPPDAKNGFREGLKKYGAAAGEMGNALPSPNAYDAKNKYEGSGKQEQYNNAMNATKDAVGKAIPMAGVFRGIEKAGIGIATATHGEEGGAVSQAMFSPSSSVMNVQESNMSGGDKALATAASFLAPGLAGQMIHADRLKTRQAEYAKRFKKQTLLERKESEQEYKMSEGLASMENLKQLRKKQLGLS